MIKTDILLALDANSQHVKQEAQCSLCLVLGTPEKKEILISHVEKKNVDSEIVQTLEKAALKGCVAPVRKPGFTRGQKEVVALTFRGCWSHPELSSLKCFSPLSFSKFKQTWP